MNKKLIATILISSTFVSFLTYNFYHIFYKYQSEIDQILTEIPAEDKELPPTVLKVLQNTENFRNKKSQIVRNLFFEAIARKNFRFTNLERIYYDFIWQITLPLRLSQKDFHIYTANKSYLRKDIYSFKNGAKFYFNKDWKDLAEEEVLVLVAISYSPEFIRNRNSEYFDRIINELIQTYYTNLSK